MPSRQYRDKKARRQCIAVDSGKRCVTRLDETRFPDWIWPWCRRHAPIRKTFAAVFVGLIAIVGTLSDLGSIWALFSAAPEPEPLLQIDYQGVPDPGNRYFGLTLTNRGETTAIVKSVQLYLDGRPMPSHPANGWPLLVTLATSNDRLDWLEYPTIGYDSAHSTGEKKNLLGISAEQVTRERAALVHSIIVRTRIDLCYCSHQRPESCWADSTQKESGRGVPRHRVEHCPSA